MKRILLFILFLIGELTMAQEISICGDSISYYHINDSLYLSINNRKISGYAKVVEEQYSNVHFSVECIKNGFDLICTRQNGNEYYISHYLFAKQNDDYINTHIYSVYSNRHEYLLNGADNKNREIERLIGTDNFLDLQDITFINIQRVSGFQEEKEIVEKPYYTLATELYNEGKFNYLKLITDKFVLNKLNILNSESVANLNNIAFYAQKAGSHSEAVYILEKVIEKEPKRAVAYLNIGDSYWQLEDHSQAKENYNKYIRLMKDKNNPKIPNYVLGRAGKK